MQRHRVEIDAKPLIAALRQLRRVPSRHVPRPDTAGAWFGKSLAAKGTTYSGFGRAHSSRRWLAGYLHTGC
jgi:hypothetical protein